MGLPESERRGASCGALPSLFVRPPFRRSNTTQPRENVNGSAGHRSLYLSHAKRPLYHLSYTPSSRGAVRALRNYLLPPTPAGSRRPRCAAASSCRPPRGGDGLYLRPALRRERPTAIQSLNCVRSPVRLVALGCRYPQPRDLLPCPRAFAGVPGAPFGAPAVSRACWGVPAI